MAQNANRSRGSRNGQPNRVRNQNKSSNKRGGANKTNSEKQNSEQDAGNKNQQNRSQSRRNQNRKQNRGSQNRKQNTGQAKGKKNNASSESKPQIGDSKPAPKGAQKSETKRDAKPSQSSRRRRGSRGRGRNRQNNTSNNNKAAVALDEANLAKRRGKERDGRPVGRFLMLVHVHNGSRHIAIMEGRNLVEYYVSKPADDVTQIHGNVYMGRVQNVLPGMEAAFVDIGTPKAAVLYRNDVQYDETGFEGTKRNPPRIEEMLKARQMVLCQVTKNPIAHKGARLTQEISLPGRFVVLMPNSETYGISKRLPDRERKRLRKILDRIKPEEHGLIVRTAARHVTEQELALDVERLLGQWETISAEAAAAGGPKMLHREPDLAVRLIREEFTAEFRGVIIDDEDLFRDVSGYMSAVTPALADRIEYFQPKSAGLPLFERYHVYEQLQKALDKKVWLPSGGSLIIEHTEALTVIDVNTGRNVGTSSLEETVFANNLEAAREVANQLRLRDIGGIIVIDFVDMESKANRAEVIRVFREALANDNTRTHVYDISDLGLVEMTRKRIGEGLLESVSVGCSSCESSGLLFDASLFSKRQPIPGPTTTTKS